MIASTQCKLIGGHSNVYQIRIKIKIRWSNSDPQMGPFPFHIKRGRQRGRDRGRRRGSRRSSGSVKLSFLETIWFFY